jgi:hypothetical protein
VLGVAWLAIAATVRATVPARRPAPGLQPALAEAHRR